MDARNVSDFRFGILNQEPFLFGFYLFMYSFMFLSSMNEDWRFPSSSLRFLFDIAVQMDWSLWSTSCILY